MSRQQCWHRKRSKDFSTAYEISRTKETSLIIITHKLDEVMAIADTVTVMRRGQTVNTCSITDTDPAMLAEMMLGEPVIPSTLTREQTEHTTPMLCIEGVTLSASANTERKYRWRNVLSNRETGKRLLNEISLDVFPGEIVGIAGVEGNGQTELVEGTDRSTTD